MDACKIGGVFTVPTAARRASDRLEDEREVALQVEDIDMMPSRTCASHPTFARYALALRRGRVWQRSCAPCAGVGFLSEC